MNLKKNNILLGRGRVSSAAVIDGVCALVMESEGRLIKKSIKEGGRQVYGSRVISYCDDCWILPDCKLERIDEEIICSGVSENV